MERHMKSQVQEPVLSEMHGEFLVSVDTDWLMILAWALYWSKHLLISVMNSWIEASVAANPSDISSELSELW